ncbi:glycosyltransferase family 4 protein [candidate division FCPU426 bacterium]|nr:glycosyltransferase family 4 protein [candidate division FCPU426 bacterium]
MRILYCQTAYPPSAGGAQTHLHEIARRLRARHGVQVVCHWSENRTDWLRGVTVHAPENRGYVHDGVPVRQLNFTAAEKKTIAPWAWAYYFAMGASVKRISSLLVKKMDEQIKDVDIVHAGRIGREFLAWAAFTFARKRKIPFVLTPFHHPRWQGWRYRWYIRLYRAADAVMALTQAEKNILTGLGVAPDKVRVIGHAPVLPSLPAAPGYFGPGGPVVLFLGQKYAYKGLDQMVRSMPLVWSAIPQARFAFIGPQTSHSRRLFAAGKDQRVIEKGYVPESEKMAALADCAVFCLPSRQESFGGVFAEAWSLGKPVIGGNAPAVAELILPGVDGEVVGPEPEELARHLIALLKDPGRAQQLGQAGQRKIREKYNWEGIAKKQEQVYQRLISGPRA